MLDAAKGMLTAVSQSGEMLDRIMSQRDRLDDWRREEASLETGICLLLGFKL